MFGLKEKKQIQELRQALNDISIRMAELEKQISSNQAIFESMVEGVMTVDKDTRIVSINNSIEEIFGILREEAKGRFFLEVVRNNDIADIINRVLKEGKLISQELTLVWPLQKNFKINASPILENNAISGCLLVIHDITEMRRLETVRRDFVANVSHELKTPLTSIKGFVETLLEGALEDKQNSRHFLEIIQSHANRLDNLIRDLLDLSSLESQGIKLNIERINLKELTDVILAGFKSQLKKKAVNAENALSESLVVNADKDRIGQVLTNIIDNAIKFNRENGTIRIYNQDSGDSIKVFVEDSGIGIPPKDIPRIFERFYRVDKARSRELGGTGLGLSIVKHIIELHGGSVVMESVEGLGSKVFFTLLK